MQKIVQPRCSILILCGLFGCSGGADDNGTLMQPGTPVAPTAPPAASMNTSGASAEVGAAAPAAPTPQPSSAGQAAPSPEQGSAGQATPTPQPSSAGQAAPPPDVTGEPGLHWENGVLVFRTEPFTVGPGGERYLCWTVMTDEALKVRKVNFAGQPGIHHLTFAQTIVPEPEGFSECETLLKTTWLPLFSAGAGANTLSLPAGIAHELTSGTQLLVQLHLVNTGSTEVTKQMQLTMEVTDEPNTQPVQIGGIGSFRISLPPGEASKITSECYLPWTSRVVALMPHMHRKATSMILEMGTSPNDAQPIYARDPWDFDQQSIDNLDMMFEEGKFVRVTCNYDNDTDKTIGYGESSADEMCFLGAFWVGDPINCVVF